ncbi:hypothetical protein [uncultured Kordia sp.]|uniref:hypothetical protein n=1 Tax=uncultured Kordia sp. TaxID=507699 RepID=UPI0026171AF9|nr:hypothetical protein [uncultured Kordia sp.]
MKVTTTNELELENDELRMNFASDDPTETPKPGDGDGTVDTGEEDDDEEVIKPYN